MSKVNAYLRDILDSARLIQDYLKGMSFGDFESDTVRQDAAMRRFEIIGEATERLSAEVRAQFPGIPWELAAGMRDVLIHDHDDVNLEIIWTTVRDNLPGLIQQLEAYLAQRPPVE